MKAKRITVVKPSSSARLQFVRLSFLSKISIIKTVRRAYEGNPSVLDKLLS